MTQRVMVFLDYQNCYRGAREAFGMENLAHWEGQFDPVRLGNILALRQPGQPTGERKLCGVRLYRGQPSSSKDPKGYAANRRQTQTWEDRGCVVINRPLRYPGAWPRVREGEKGIDVQLAIDFVTHAIHDAYDIGILMSTDTDLVPALEAVLDIGKRCEVATWRGPGYRRRLSVKGREMWCHWVDSVTYGRVADPTDYNRRR